MSTKTNANAKTTPAKKSLFGLSPTQLKIVKGGSGVIVGPPTP